MRLPAEPASRLALVLAAWVLTRVTMIVLSQDPNLYPAQDNAFEMTVVSAWGAALAGDGGPVPLRDGPWEYPFGALPIVWGPALFDAPYILGFVAHMALWDAGMVLLLALVGLRRGSLGGAWLWVAAVPLLGPVALGRFDVVPTVFAVAGLVASPVAAGALLAVGGAVKLWPALLLPLLLVLQPARARLLAGAIAAGVVVLAAAAAYGVLPRLLTFLTYQRERGLEVEAVPALPLMARYADGDPAYSVAFDFGSYQVYGPAADLWLTVSNIGTALVLLGVAFLTWRARRSPAPDAAVVLAVLLMSGVLLFDKVLSAQYPVWLAGLVALALCRPGSGLRPAVAPLCGLLVLTQLVYPLLFQDLLGGGGWPVLLLAARDVLLLVIAVVAARAAWQLAPTSEHRVPADEQDRQQPEPAR